MNPVHVVTLRQFGITALTVRQGTIAGLALGFSTNFGARIEAEYFNFGAQYDATSAVVGGGEDIADKADQELVRSDERIGGVNINSLFVNIYYDLPVSWTTPSLHWRRRGFRNG